MQFLAKPEESLLLQNIVEDSDVRDYDVKSALEFRDHLDGFSIGADGDNSLSAEQVAYSLSDFAIRFDEQDHLGQLYDWKFACQCKTAGWYMTGQKQP